MSDQRNQDNIIRLLRVIADTEDAKSSGRDIIYNAAADEIASLRARVGELERENFAFAAGLCPHHYGDEHGHSGCREIDNLKQQIAAFKAAAVDFIAKVDRGEARSKRSYAAFKAALSLTDELREDRK